MSYSWRPMGADPERFSSLLEDVPAHMEVPLFEWFNEALHYNRMPLAKLYDSASRNPRPVAPIAGLGLKPLWEILLKRREMIHFLDFLVWSKSKLGPYPDEQDVHRLDVILESNGSAWKVGRRDGGAGLERRVPEGVELAANEAMSSTATAGKLLAEAWHAAFGSSPDPEKAYSKAVKSVEAASIPVVSPANTSATMGSVIAQMRQQGDWGYASDRKHATDTPSAVLVGMMQALWTGQNDRHAGQPGYTPTTQAAAEAAVLLAVTLVQWFASGSVQRR